MNWRVTSPDICTVPTPLVARSAGTISRDNNSDNAPGETIAERPSGLQAHIDAGVADAAAVDVDEAVGGETAQAPLDGPMGGRRLDGDEVD